MPQVVKCPSCQSPVTITEGETGIRCGICWAEVPTTASGTVKAPETRTIAPASPPPPAPVSATSTDDFIMLPESEPSAPAPVPTSPAIAAAPTAPRPAKAIVAKPATVRPAAVPIADTSKKPAELPKPPKISRPKSEEKATSDNDDDDDLPRRRGKGKDGKKKSTTGTALLIMLGIAFIFVIGMGGLGAVAYRLFNGSDDSSQASAPTTSNFVPTPPPAPQGFNAKAPITKAAPPAPIPQPPIFNPPAPAVPARPFWQRDWEQVNQADGFDALMPSRARRTLQSISIDDERLRGYRFESEEGGMRYRVITVDVPNEMNLTPDQIFRKLPTTFGTPNPGSKPITFAGHPAVEIEGRSFIGETEITRVLKVGPRVFAFTVCEDANVVRNSTGLDSVAQRNRFFDSVKLNFNPNTPAPPSTKRKTQLPPPIAPPMPNPNPAPPMNPPQPSPDTVLPGAMGPLKVAGKIAPFNAAVRVPGKNEVITFSLRGSGKTARGSLQRYSGADFKLLGTYNLVAPVSMAIIDEKNGRLFAATVTRDLLGNDLQRLTTAGDIQIYDLKKLTSNGYTDQSDVAPTSTISLGEKVTGMQLGIDGSALYVTAVNAAPFGTKGPNKTRIIQYDPATTKMMQTLELPQPVISLRLSPNGKTLYACEFQYNFSGFPVSGGGNESKIQVIDAKMFKLKEPIAFPGPISDIAFVDETNAIALVSTQTGGKLYLVEGNGTISDVSPAGPLKNTGAGYMTTTAQGILVLSVRIGAGTDMVAYQGGMAKIVGSAAVMPGSLISGAVVLSPDDKLTAYGTGVVLDISALK